MRSRGAAPRRRRPVTLFSRIAPLLKKAARQRRMTYRSLGTALGLTESGVKKLLNGPDCSANRLAEICAILDLDLGDLVSRAAEPREERADLDEGTQAWLLANPAALELWWRITAEGLTASAAADLMGMTRPRLRKTLRALENRSLIRYGGVDDTSSRLPAIWRLRSPGPLQERVIRDWTSAALQRAQASYGNPGHWLTIIYERVDPEAVLEFERTVRQALMGLSRRAQTERVLGGGQHYTVLLATAPTSLLDMARAHRPENFAPE